MSNVIVWCYVKARPVGPVGTPSEAVPLRNTVGAPCIYRVYTFKKCGLFLIITFKRIIQFQLILSVVVVVGNLRQSLPSLLTFSTNSEIGVEYTGPVPQ